MKISTGVAAFMATGAMASATHHKHQHFHDKRDVVGGEKIVVDTKTILMYSYKGQMIDEPALCKGLLNGSISWVGNNPPRPSCNQQPNLEPSDGTTFAGPEPSEILPMGNPESSEESPVAGGAFHETQEQSPTPLASSSNPESSSQELGNTNPGNLGESDSGYILTNENTDKDFPDGQIDCSDFPSAYGAIDVSWAGLGGWSGIQYAQVAGGFVNHLATADSGSDGCKASSDGQETFCSYACPAGFQKSQWPQSQGSADYAVSVGGLKCGSDGKLHLTNPSLSSKLCTRGTDTLTIVNKLSQGAAVCRTDYPGTEAETIPLFASAGQEVPLTCPKSSEYYTHQGMAITAHYYVNDAGTSVNTACQWGRDESAKGLSYGNWAPIVIGVGEDNNGATWLSLQSSCQNNPEVCNDLTYSIELVGDFGGNNGCYYTQSGGIGYWCSQGSLDNFDPSSSSCVTKQAAQVPGCTVQLLSGTASYNFVPTKN